MKNILEKIVDRNRHLTKKGKVADYIPALSSANPDDIGMCILNTKNEIFKVGQYDKKFTIQSISKVLTLILAILDNGIENVFSKVGYEGTDEPFNTLRKLDLPYINKPANPMINAGAIVTTSLIKGEGEERFNRILELIRFVADNPKIELNKEVYLSEKSTGDKNKAIAYLMKSKGIIEGNTDDVLDTYFKQCSIEIDAVDLAKIGRFIANGCEGLSTKFTVSNKELSSVIVGIMITSGMYNYSGEFATRVGIPSKSGVGGGIMGVLPNKMGIGIYGPALDENFNTIAGIGIMRDLSRELNLSLF